MSGRDSKFRKSGPGRKHKQGKRANPRAGWDSARPTHVTLVGSKVEFEGVKLDSRWHELAGASDGWCLARRIWLGGISAMRGY